LILFFRISDRGRFCNSRGKLPVHRPAAQQPGASMKK
jgi:hypothetical protein